MPQDTENDVATLFVIHRELGRHDERLKAVEIDVTEIKGGLAGMHEKINQIWLAVTKNTSTDDGKRSTWQFIGTLADRMLTIILAAAAAIAAFLAITPKPPHP